MKKPEKSLAVLLCHDYASHPQKPNDISEAHLTECPNCKNSMWYSVKMQMFHDKTKEDKSFDIIFECYACFEKRLAKDPEKFMPAGIVQL